MSAKHTLKWQFRCNFCESRKTVYTALDGKKKMIPTLRGGSRFAADVALRLRLGLILPVTVFASLGGC